MSHSNIFVVNPGQSHTKRLVSSKLNPVIVRTFFMITSYLITCMGLHNFDFSLFNWGDTLFHPN
jgi:hypothetical protein